MNGFGLAIISGERRGTLVPIFHPNFSVGRTPGNQFVLSEEQAAVHQFRLVWEPDGNQWFLQACGTHPTRLNGVEYGYSHTALPPVKPGDVISFGQTDFFFLEL